MSCSCRRRLVGNEDLGSSLGTYLRSVERTLSNLMCRLDGVLTTTDAALAAACAALAHAALPWAPATRSAANPHVLCRLPRLPAIRLARRTPSPPSFPFLPPSLLNGMAACLLALHHYPCREVADQDQQYKQNHTRTNRLKRGAMPYCADQRLCLHRPNSAFRVWVQRALR